MHILIVDDDPLLTDCLVETIGEQFPLFWIESAVSPCEALATAGRMDKLDLLLSDIKLGNVDGFTLREKILEQFPNLQSVFITGHELNSFGISASGKKILRKPLQYEEVIQAVVNAETLLHSEPEPIAVTCAKESPIAEIKEKAFASSEAHRKSASHRQPITRNNSSGDSRHAVEGKERSLDHQEVLLDRQGFTGKLDQFQLVDIIQLCCLSGRTGRLTISKGLNSGVLFFSRNNIIHATCGSRQGEEAAFEIISWQSGRFSFAEDLQPDDVTIHRSWENLLMESAVEGDESSHSVASKKETGPLGLTLGVYHVTRKLGIGDWGSSYEATVAETNERFTIKILSRECSTDPVLLQKFIADASAKCSIVHPLMISVPHGVEEIDGYYFYPRQFLEGKSLADYQATGQRIDDETVCNLLSSVAKLKIFLNRRKIPHAPLKASSIYITENNEIRLANIATFESPERISDQSEIRELSKIVGRSMPAGVGSTPGLRQLLARMLVQNSAGFPSWGTLLQAVKSLNSKRVLHVTPATEPASLTVVSASNQTRSKKESTLLVWCPAAVAVLLLIAIATYCLFLV
jgi:DNA-binding NarL/FixJ family response regulator